MHRASRRTLIAIGVTCSWLCTGTPALADEEDLVKLFESANPAIVVISAYSSSGTPLSQGSGFIADPHGLVVTNDHVIDGADAVAVRRPGAEPVFATHIQATSEEWDLAVLKIKGKKLPSLKLAPKGTARVGMRVIAIGSPLGLENTMSEGIISGIRANSVLQITTPISPGSSGGALLSQSGVVLGATTLMLRGGQNINFAVPSGEISALLRAARHGGPVRPLHALSTVPDPRARGKSDSAYYRAFRTLLESSCGEMSSVDTLIAEAISVGVPLYNTGSHIGCYRIYEGAGYKLLYLLGDECGKVQDILKTGLKQAESDDTPTKKAWTMRRTFDVILGEPTRYQ